MTRPPLLKRAALGIAAVVLTLAAYVVGAPIVVAIVIKHFPTALPWIVVVYGPVDYYCRHPELPGCETYLSYVQWCFAHFEVN